MDSANTNCEVYLEDQLKWVEDRPQSVTIKTQRFISLFLGALQEKPASKRDASELVPILSGLALIAVAEGVLAMESLLEELDDPYLRKGIETVVHGEEPEIQDELLEVCQEQLQRELKIRCRMIRRASAMMNQGKGPQEVQNICRSYFSISQGKIEPSDCPEKNLKDS